MCGYAAYSIFLVFAHAKLWFTHDVTQIKDERIQR